LYACIAPQGQGAPLIDQAFTIEKDGKQRRGHGFLIRVPFTRNRPTIGLVVGLWKQTFNQQEKAQHG